MQTLSEAEAAGLRLTKRLGIGSQATSTDLLRIAAADFVVG